MPILYKKYKDIYIIYATIIKADFFVKNSLFADNGTDVVKEIVNPQSRVFVHLAQGAMQVS